jgi:transcription initiation factor TFIIIB Brf1 subunit/transcription initiation factor TFIIB
MMQLEPVRKGTRKALEALDKLREEFKRCVRRLARELDKEKMPTEAKDAVLLGTVESTLHGLIQDIEKFDSRLVSTMLDDMRREFVLSRGKEIGYG